MAKSSHVNVTVCQAWDDCGTVRVYDLGFEFVDLFLDFPVRSDRFYPSVAD